MPQKQSSARGHMSAYPGDALLVTDGANIGDGFSISRDLCLGDRYELNANVLPLPMQKRYARKANAKPGDMVLDCSITLMSDTGQHISANLYASLDTQGCVKKTHLSTDMLLHPKTPYELINIKA